MDECRLANTSRTDHEHDGAWSVGQHLFSWRTNGIKNGVESFQESWMRNYAALLKIFLAYLWWLQQQGSVKKFRLLHLLLFLIQGSTITTKDVNVSIIFGVSHHGGSGGWNGSKFFPICPATSNSITLNCG